MKTLTDIPMPLISIIIANRNGESYLKDCLTSLLKSSYKDYEVMIIDNNSTDSSIEIIKEFVRKDLRIRLLRNKKNLGVPYSRNKAIKNALGDILVFLDNDTRVDKNWLEGIIQTFKIDRTIGVVQCKIFDYNKPDVIQEVGMKLYPYTGFGRPLGRGEKDRGQFDNPVEIIALGAALAVKKEIARRMGGFDLKLMHTIDDLDFSWRIWISGYKVMLSPNSRVYHYTKVHGHNYKMYFHLSKNSLRMITKNYESMNVIKFLPLSIAINILGGIFVLFSRRSIAGILGVFLGIVWYVYTLPDTIRERAKVQKLRKVQDKDIFPKVMVSSNMITFLRVYFKGEKESVSLLKGYQ